MLLEPREYGVSGVVIASLLGKVEIGKMSNQ
jgi:hypothetical protein